MTLKKFIKYFDDMNELYIYDWTRDTKEDPLKCILFEGCIFDKGAKKRLKDLYSQGYVLDRNDDGNAVMLFPYINAHGVSMCKVQINVRKPDERP